MAKNRTNEPHRDDYDDFHEAISPAMSSDYRRVSERDINLAAANSVAGQLVSTLVGLLTLLLMVRFFTHMFSNDTTIGFVNLVNSTTDWVTGPFQAVFQTIPAGMSGFFDIPAIAAIIVVVTLGYLLNRLISISSRGNRT